MTAGGNASFLNGVNGAQSLVVDAGTGQVLLQDSGAVTPLTSVTLTGAPIIVYDMRTTGAQQYNGDVIAGGFTPGDIQLVTSGANVTITGSLQLDASLDIVTAILGTDGDVSIGDIDGAQPLRIDADLYNLYLENGVWRSATGGTPDEKELEALISALKTLQVDGVADEDLQRDLAETEADLALKVQSLAGEVQLELITLNDAHFIHSSEFALFFKLSALDYDRLMGIDAGRVSGESKAR